jgi:hypothetical protein
MRRILDRELVAVRVKLQVWSPKTPKNDSRVKCETKPQTNKKTKKKEEDLGITDMVDTVSMSSATASSITASTMDNQRIARVPVVRLPSGVGSVGENITRGNVDLRETGSDGESDGEISMRVQHLNGVVGHRASNHHAVDGATILELNLLREGSDERVGSGSTIREHTNVVCAQGEVRMRDGHSISRVVVLARPACSRVREWLGVNENIRITREGGQNESEILVGAINTNLEKRYN